MNRTGTNLFIGLMSCLLITGCVKPKIDYTPTQIAALKLNLSGESEIPEGAVVDEFNGYVWNCIKIPVRLRAQIDKGQVTTRVTSFGRIFRGAAKLDDRGLGDTYTRMRQEDYLIHTEIDLPHQLARVAVNNQETDVGGCSTPWFDLKVEAADEKS